MVRPTLGWILALLAVAAVAPAVAAPPKVTSLYPAGGARGSSTTITAAGEFATWPVKAWCDEPGLSLEAEKEKGKFKATIAADATPGVALVRIYSDEGSASLRPFMIGAIPEAEDTEANDSPERAQSVTLPVTVNGRLAKPGDVDAFAFELKAGQTVAASLLANQVLGSPMDGVLQIGRIRELGPAVERVEAVVLENNDDARGLDPHAVFTANEDGRYLVRIFAFPAETNASITFAGAETYIYRLTITSGGCIDHPLPLALTRGKATDLELRGWNLSGDLAKSHWSGNSSDERGAAIFRPDVTGAWRLPVVDLRSVVADPAASVANPQQIELPVVISGEIAAAREADAFRFAAKKGMKIRVGVESRRLGFALDPVITIRDASGKTVSEADDGAQGDRDPAITFTAAADGDYTAVIRDLHHQGGLRYAYRMSLTEVAPDFTLSAPDAHVVAAGKTATIEVTVNRQEGFSEPIELNVMGMPEGVTASPVTSPPSGAEGKLVKLVLTAKEGAMPWQGPIRVAAESKGATAWKRWATYPATGTSEPRNEIWLTITK